MASTAPVAFAEFSSLLELTATHRQNIWSHRRSIEAILGTEWDIDRTLFGGSHARRTKKWVPPGTRSDVDLYVVLGGGQKSAYQDFWAPRSDALLDDIKATLKTQLRTPTI